MLPFALSNLLFCSLLMLGAGTFGYATRRWPDTWCVLPRHRVTGEIIGIVCLVWSAYHVLPMLEGGLVRYRGLIKLLVPIAAFLGYFYLNYLFSRALGGLLLLVVTYLLHAAFVAHVPVRPLYSIVCYVLGGVGMFLVATPWCLRDALQKATDSPRWRLGLTAVCGGLALFFAIFAFLG